MTNTLTEPAQAAARSAEADTAIQGIVPGRASITSDIRLLRAAGDPDAIDSALQHVEPGKRAPLSGKVMVEACSLLVTGPELSHEGMALAARLAFMSPDSEIRKGALEALLAGTPGFGAFVATTLLLDSREQVRLDSLDSAYQINPGLGRVLAVEILAAHRSGAERMLAQKILASTSFPFSGTSTLPEKFDGLELEKGIAAMSAVLSHPDVSVRGRLLEFLAPHRYLHAVALMGLTSHDEPCVAAAALSDLSKAEPEMARLCAASLRKHDSAAVQKAVRALIGD